MHHAAILLLLMKRSSQLLATPIRLLPCTNLLWEPALVDEHEQGPAGEVEAIDYTHSDGQPSPFPLIRCRNIYVLPGIPELLRAKWKV